MGGMPGCPAKPMDLAQKAPCKGCLLFFGSRRYILYEGSFIRDSFPRLTYTNDE